MKALVGTHDIVLITLDTLRYDVAQLLWSQGKLPHFAQVLPDQGWQRRDAPGNFTYASHQAFFAGFLPTPSCPGPHPRLLALRFSGSESIGEQTAVFDSPTIVAGLAARGYHTLCIGGTGFFNKRTPLGKVMPGYFSESHWTPSLGVTDPNSTKNQFELASQCLSQLPSDTPAFAFINVSAMHQPNYFYSSGRSPEAGDDIESHGAALQYVDTQLPILMNAMKSRGPTALILCSDHGTLYGEDGQVGHRLSHEKVWTVPYAEALLFEEAS